MDYLVGEAFGVVGNESGFTAECEMVSNKEVDAITQALMSLPPEKISAVRDYVEFLKARYGANGAVDENDEWTDEDLRDFATASADYREHAEPWQDAPESPAQTSGNDVKK